MKTAFGVLAAGLLATGLLVGTAGCELTSCEDESAPAGADAGAGAEETEDEEGCIRVESLKKFEGTSETKEVSYNSGGKVRIESRNGRVVVKSGSGDTVEVTFTPFSLRGHSKKDEAIAEIETKLNKIADGDGSGGAVIKTSRESGASSGLGADLEVTLPAGFDGALEIEQDNGPVDVQSAGGASSIDVENTGTGDCDVVSGGSTTSTTVTCDSDVTVSVAQGTIDVRCKGSGDVSVSIGGVSGGGGNVTADNGDVALGLPAGETYSVQATASADGTVDFGTPPDSCTVDEAAVSSKTLACGTGGPNYVVSAGPESAFEKNVTVSYR